MQVTGEASSYEVSKTFSSEGWGWQAAQAEQALVLTLPPSPTSPPGAAPCGDSFVGVLALPVVASWKSKSWLSHRRAQRQEKPVALLA